MPTDVPPQCELLFSISNGTPSDSKKLRYQWDSHGDWSCYAYKHENHGKLNLAQFSKLCESTRNEEYKLPKYVSFNQQSKAQFWSEFFDIFDMWQLRKQQDDTLEETTRQNVDFSDLSNYFPNAMPFDKVVNLRRDGNCRKMAAAYKGQQVFYYFLYYTS